MDITNEEELDQYFDVALKIVRKAGEVVKKAITSRDKKIDLKTTATDLVTETDRAVEKLIVNGLKSNFPTHKFIGEEGTAELGGDTVNEFTDDPTWIIDPIDGTMNFVHSNPMVSILVGLVIRKTPVIGIVYIPVLDQMYTAIRGRGAYMNDQKLQVSTSTELKQSLYLLEVWAQQNDPSVEKYQVENFSNLLPKVHSLRTVGSAGINLALIAAGNADAYAQVGIHCWDLVAGSIIVKEAGGILLDPRTGADFDYMSRGILAASSPELAKQVMELNLKYHETTRDHPEKAGF